MNLRQIIKTSKISSLIGAGIGVWFGICISVFFIYLSIHIGWLFVFAIPVSPLVIAWAILDEWNL